MPSSRRPQTPRWAQGDRVDIVVAGRAVVALAPSDRRVRVGLVMPVMDRVVDVSVQPSAARKALSEAATSTGTADTAVTASARRSLVEAAEACDAWVPSAQLCLARAFGGVAFPLLGAVYDQGGAVVDEVPRWAAGPLAAPTIGDAASIAFADRATRPVRRALVVALRPLPDGQVDLARLALAMMSRAVLQPDRLARVLGADAVAHPPADLPDPAALEAADAVLSRWGEERTEKVLVDAAGRADGLRILLDTLRYARQLGDHGPVGALPTRLSELHDVHRALLRTDVAARQVPERRRRTATTARAAAPTPPPHRQLPPPATAPPVRGDHPLTATPAERAIDGRTLHGLTLVLPRTVGDLRRWGRLLGNCLGDFGPAVAAGRSTIIGVQRGGRLAYAVELTPTGAVRQFCGQANRAPRDPDRRAVMEMLAAGRLVDLRSPANRPWLQGVPTATGASRTG